MRIEVWDENPRDGASPIVDMLWDGPEGRAVAAGARAWYEREDREDEGSARLWARVELVTLSPECERPARFHVEWDRDSMEVTEDGW